MSIDEILDMWELDCKVNPNKLDDTSIQTIMLHSKYLPLLTRAKLRLKKAESDFAELKRDKWLWFHGKMSRGEIDKRGWDYDPLDGLKVLKSDMGQFIETDQHVKAAKLKIDYLKTEVEALEEILNTIRWRHSHVKNIISWRQFEAGN